jgi:hypothetical protein
MYELSCTIYLTRALPSYETEYEPGHAEIKPDQRENRDPERRLEARQAFLHVESNRNRQSTATTRQADAMRGDPMVHSQLPTTSGSLSKSMNTRRIEVSLRCFEMDT